MTRLRKAFAGISLMAATACAGSLPRAAFNDNAALPGCGEEDLRFVFENSARPVLMGNATQGIFHNDDNRVSEKWFGVLGRQSMLLGIPGNAESYARWMSQFDHVMGGTVAEKVDAVTAVIDSGLYYERDFRTYTKDPENKRDYWASPIETIAKGQGDCEDLAILKYFALRHLGVPDGRLYVLMVDSPEGDAMGHSTLLVDVDGPGNGRLRALPPSRPGGSGARMPEEAAGPTDVERISESRPPLRTPREDASPLPPRKGYTIYYAMNGQGIWSVPENTVSHWAAPEREPAACVTLPKGAWRKSRVAENTASAPKPSGSIP